MAEVLELPTERPGVVVRELATPADDVAYQESYAASRPEIRLVDREADTRHLSVIQTALERVKGERAGRMRMGVWDGPTFVASVNARPQPDGAVEIGYWADSRHTGEHYTSLGATALVGFLSQYYQRIFAQVLEGNEASAHVSENAGLTRVAQAAGWITLEKISERPAPFPGLEEAAKGVERGDYRVIDGSDDPAHLQPGDCRIATGKTRVPIIPGVYRQGVCSIDGVGRPVVSFLYNKLDPESRRREMDKRVIVLEGVGYGRHRDHKYQPPTWYLVGPQIGTIDHATGAFAPSAEIADAAETPAAITPKNFSIACITNGPFGVPLLANPQLLKK